MSRPQHHIVENVTGRHSFRSRWPCNWRLMERHDVIFNERLSREVFWAGELRYSGVLQMTLSWQGSIFPPPGPGAGSSFWKAPESWPTGALVQLTHLVDLQVLTILRSVTCVCPSLAIPTPPAMPTLQPHTILPGLLLGFPTRTPAMPLLGLGHLPCWGQSDLLE